MWNSIRQSISMLILLTVLTGVVYPLIVTLVAQVCFPFQANGSVLVQGTQAQGSALIGQSFSEPQYFWGRLSATSPMPYNASASGGSNYGPMNPALQAAVHARIEQLESQEHPTSPIPIDLVTSSGSGLDPHISPAAAAYQLQRVAKSRSASEDRIQELIQRHTEGRQWGFLGEPRVHVLELNLELDRSYPVKSQASKKDSQDRDASSSSQDEVR